MNSQEVAEAVVAWAREQVPDLQEGYAYPAGQTSGSLPDVVVVVQNIRTVAREPEKFPFAMLEQIDGLKCFDLEVSVMVEQEEGVEGEAAAHQALEGYAETLIGSILADATLGSRVPMISPFVEADLSEPFEERSNGIRGRAFFLNATVAEPLGIDL